MKRRNLLVAGLASLISLPFTKKGFAEDTSFANFPGFSYLKKKVVTPLKGDVDFNTLQSWIKEWPITQLPSEMAQVYDAPSGKCLLHQTLSIGARFKLTAEELEFCWSGKAPLQILDYCKAHNIDHTIKGHTLNAVPPSAWLSSCVNYKAAELLICEVVAKALYFKALGQTTVYWREPPEMDTAFDFNFVPDAAGPDVDFATDQKGYSHLRGGSVRFYTRLSFDDPDFYIDVPRFREGGKVRWIA
jgi:hypothetical protein